MSFLRKIAISVVLLMVISLNGAMAQNVGTYSGEWSGTVTYYGGVSGEWQFVVFDSGSLVGWFTGDAAGDIRGTVSDGKVSASGSAAWGMVSWTGSFSGSSFSGEWNVVEAPGSGSGTWSGEKVSDSIEIPGPGNLPPVVIKDNVSIRFGEVGPNAPINLNISNSSFKGVNIALKNKVSNVAVNISKVSREFNEIRTSEVYKAMNISSNVANENIENATINFSVAKEWLSNSNRSYSKENVSLLRIHEQQQEELPTEFTGQNSTYLNYSAQTPGFSTFVVTAEKSPQQVKEDILQKIVVYMDNPSPTLKNDILNMIMDYMDMT